MGSVHVTRLNGRLMCLLAARIVNEFQLFLNKSGRWLNSRASGLYLRDSVRFAIDEPGLSGENTRTFGICREFTALEC